MSEPRPLKYGDFECKGQGFTYASYARATPAQLLTALAEPRPSANAIGKTTSQHEDHSKDWWEAQIRLYGFKCPKWTVKGMKAVFLEKIVSALKVDAKLEGIERQLNHDYMRIDQKKGSSSASASSGNRSATDTMSISSETSEEEERNLKEKTKSREPRKLACQAKRCPRSLRRITTR